MFNSAKYMTAAIRIILVALLFAYLAYTFPFFRNLVSSEAIASLTDGRDGLGYPVLRSTVFSVVSSLLLVVGSLAAATALRAVTLAERRGRWMALLLLPFILGNVSTSFVWKLLLLDTSFPFSGPAAKFFSMMVIQFWQYGTLYIYLFWINQQLIPKNTLMYAETTGMNALEQLRDLVLPKQRNLLILLFIIGLITFYYEDAKVQFIFHASRGTDTELVNQWLYRTYQSDNLLSPDFAFEHISQFGMVVLISGLAGLLIFLFFVDRSYAGIMTSRRQLPGWKFGKAAARLLYGLLMVFTVIPIGAAFFLQSVHWRHIFQVLAFPLLLTAIAAALATLAALFLTVINRLAMQKSMSGFNRNSMFFLIGLFLMTLVPPIVVLVLGFKWMQLVGYASGYNIMLAWITGHVFLAFPLLAGFLITAHFSLKNQHITYLQVHKTTFGEQVRTLFLFPFAADYLLTFILAFSLIWNESTVNNVLADVVPSFVAELNKTIMGKEVDYGNGMNYLLVSLVLAAACILVWDIIIGRSQKNKTYELAGIR